VADPVNSGASLHDVLELQDVGVVADLGHNVRGLAVPGAEVVGDVTANAPRVGSVSVGLRVSGRSRLDNCSHGSKVHRHANSSQRWSAPDLSANDISLFERPSCDATTTDARGSTASEAATEATANTATGSAALDCCAVAPHAGLAAVKDGRGKRVIGPSPVIPVLYEGRLDFT
jgi:hypothetical protein